MIRVVSPTLATLAVALVAGMASGWTAELSGVAAPLYLTPTQCPRFRAPQFISRPLRKAYPSIEYNVRPAIKGGVYSYTFTLEASSWEMRIDSAKGTVTWIAPKDEEVHEVAIRVRGRSWR